MAYVHPAWVERQRKRFMRENAHLYIRHDAYRFMPPGAPLYVGRDVVRYAWPEAESQEPRRQSAPAPIASNDAAFAVSESELASLRWHAATMRVQLALIKLAHVLRKAVFNPDQPRVLAGNQDGGQWTSEDEDDSSPELPLAGLVIRICIAGSRSLTTDQFGNKSYWVEYQCAGGRSFIERGLGHRFRGIVLDPFQ
jgi:hypothetical protein